MKRHSFCFYHAENLELKISRPTGLSTRREAKHFLFTICIDAPPRSSSATRIASSRIREKVREREREKKKGRQETRRDGSRITRYRSACWCQFFKASYHASPGSRQQLYLSLSVYSFAADASLWERSYWWSAAPVSKKNRRSTSLVQRNRASGQRIEKETKKELVIYIIIPWSVSPFERKVTSTSAGLKINTVVYRWKGTATLPLSSNIIYLLPISWSIDSAVSGETWFTTPPIGWLRVHVTWLELQLQNDTRARIPELELPVRKYSRYSAGKLSL